MFFLLLLSFIFLSSEAELFPCSIFLSCFDILCMLPWSFSIFPSPPHSAWHIHSHLHLHLHFLTHLHFLVYLKTYTLWGTQWEPRPGHNASVVAGLLAPEPGNRLDASIPTLWHSSSHTCMQDNLLRMSKLCLCGLFLFAALSHAIPGLLQGPRPDLREYWLII